MGWFSHRRNNVPVPPEQKWDYIQLNDFKASGPFTYIAYAYLFISLLISIAVYVVDTFTAVNLLAFNKWSSEIEPAISFDITKWIFSITIILSVVNLGYEHLRANLVIRRGSVAESFLDNLAVRLQSVRFGSFGWKRFLVFAELTKSKKGAEYIALFTYFSFQAWIRIIFCSGPRQVVNAITLYSVYTAKLQVEGDNFQSSFESFFKKIEALAEQDYQQALILSGMLFTLVIWVFSALSFILAIMFFVFFLWGWIPREDGGLSGYCERKVTKRLLKIVSAKVNAAIADQERQKKKAELKAAKKTGAVPAEERKATLPNLMAQGDDKLPDMPMLSRTETVATLPLYTSRPGTADNGFELNKMRPMPGRTETTSTVGSRAPLLQAGSAADMGMASPGFPSPGYAPTRTGTMSSTNTRMGPPPLQRVPTNNSNFGGGSFTQTPSTYSSENGYPPMPQQLRSPTATSVTSYGMPPRFTPAPRGTYDDYNRTASPGPLRQMPSQSQFNDFSSNGRASPAPSFQQMAPQGQFDNYPNGGRASPAPPFQQMGPQGHFDNYPNGGRASPAPSQYNRPQGPAYGQGQGQGGYPGGRPAPGAYPNRSQTGPVPYRGPPVAPQPQRNMTAPPMPQQSYSPAPAEYFNRPGTAQSQRSMQGVVPPRQPTPQRQPTNASYETSASSSAYSDLESQRGTPGPRY